MTKCVELEKADSRQAAKVAESVVCRRRASKTVRDLGDGARIPRGAMGAGNSVIGFWRNKESMKSNKNQLLHDCEASVEFKGCRTIASRRDKGACGIGIPPVGPDAVSVLVAPCPAAVRKTAVQVALGAVAAMPDAELARGRCAKTLRTPRELLETKG